MQEQLTAPAVILELTLLLVGIGLLWRLAFSPAARARRTAPVLAAWDAPVSEFFLYLWMIFCGAILGQLVAGGLLALVKVDETGRIIFGTALFDLGMLAGVFAFRVRSAPPAVPESPPAPVNIFLAGAATILVALPIVDAVGVAWQYLLEICGLPAEPQDIVARFGQVNSPWFLTVMIGVAGVLAPITEEMIFRAGLFRYLRTRLPRWAALLVPACLFAALHQNLATFAQLVTLGIFFSLGYERTGRIGTSIVAHALFNLHTIILILLGVAS